ncbi:MAG: PAS domain S-box protein [Lentisphaerae bacterium]|nr:PAS domain S-box protein [Lentisphaerota bacterium]
MNPERLVADVPPAVPTSSVPHHEPTPATGMPLSAGASTTPRIGHETTRTERDMALLESEGVFRALIEAAPEGIMVQREGRFVYVNPALCTLLGATASDELLGKDFASLLAPECLALVNQRIRQQCETGQPAPLVDMVYLRLDGSRIDVETTAVPIRYQDRPAHLVFIRDVSARKQAEAEQRRLMAAAEQSGESIVITDAAGLIQYVNPAFVLASGYSRTEAIGQNPRLLKSGQQDAALYTALWTTITSGNTWLGRMVNKRKDGSLYTEEATISPVRNEEGRIVNFVAIKRDITGHLHLEAQFHQAQRMESVGRLAGGVAHDFNNLLMGIMGCAELCRDEVGKDHRISAWIDEIISSAERSAAITRQLLAFARKQVIVPVVLDFNQAVAGMLKLLRRLLGEDIELVWSPTTGAHTVMMDPSQIDQILANLTVNARDAINGVGNLTIATRDVSIGETFCASHAGATPGHYVKLSVTDNGCGMDAATLEHIFEPFYTTKGVGEGTGLGLATVYGIVSQNNGFVHVESAPQRGTTFHVYLPQCEDAAAPPEDRPPACPRGTETILLVEDEKSIRVTGKALLEILGYTVLTAESPEAALRIVAEHAGPIDLLITDVVMPGMNGRELATRLVELRPGIRYLFMSGYTADIIAHRGVLDQGVNFLPKPFGLDQIAGTVRHVLDQDSDAGRPDHPLTVPGGLHLRAR